MAASKPTSFSLELRSLALGALGGALIGLGISYVLSDCSGAKRGDGDVAMTIQSMAARGGSEKRVTVFCGSSVPRGRSAERICEATASLGKEMARRGIEVVFGGGDVGLMGLLARSAHEAGGKVLGVIPRALRAKEVAGESVQASREIVTDTMHERKAAMAALAHGFIALPGGFGTFEELMEAATWTQLGIQDKVIGVLNVDGYYDPLSKQLEAAVAAGFIRPAAAKIIVFDSDPLKLLDKVLGTTVSREAQFRLDWSKGEKLAHQEEKESGK